MCHNNSVPKSDIPNNQHLTEPSLPQIRDLTEPSLSQIRYMESVIDALNGNQNALLESPTGRDDSILSSLAFFLLTSFSHFLGFTVTV